MSHDVIEEEDMLKPLSKVIRWVYSFALGYIVKLIEIYPTPG